MSRKTLILCGFLVVAALFVVLSSFFTLNEGDNALIVRLGAPVGVEKTPGLKFKAPFIDNVIVNDARLLLLEPPSEQVILGDQKRIVAQIYTRFRIVDPLRFYQSLHNLTEARAQLTQVVSTAMRREFGQINLPALLSPRRRDVVENVHADVSAKFAPLGVDVMEVRLHRADLPLETSRFDFHALTFDCVFAGADGVLAQGTDPLDGAANDLVELLRQIIGRKMQ